MTKDIDWTRYNLAIDGATIDDKGYYICEECQERLVSSGLLLRDEDGRRIERWACPSCEMEYEFGQHDMVIV